LIATIAAIGVVFLLAIIIIGLGYLAASGNAMGKFAPVGDPVNGKTK